MEKTIKKDTRGTAGIPAPNTKDNGTGGNIPAYETGDDPFKKELLAERESMVRGGYFLKNIRDMGLYPQDKGTGLTAFYGYVCHKYKISQKKASQMIRTYENFSDGKNSPKLDARYVEYSTDQLIEMLPMKEGDRERITPEMTVDQIIEEKRAVRSRKKAAHKEKGLKTKAAKTAHDIMTLTSRKARMEFLNHPERWEGGPTHEDKHVGARYYKAEFPDGCILTAVRYSSSWPDDGNSAGRLQGDGYGIPHFHMRYSDFYLMGRTEEEYEKKRGRNFKEAEISPEEVLDYLDEQKNGNLPDCRPIEFDTGDPETEHDETLPYITRQYFKFYKKNGYIPKYFGTHNCKEFTDTAPTLMTCSGNFGGYGSVTIFDLERNHERIMNDSMAEPGQRKADAEKLRAIATPPADKKPRDIGKIRFYVRKPTPGQISELMGNPAEDAQKCAAGGVSDSKFCKLSGKAIVPQNVSEIFKKLPPAGNHPIFLRARQNGPEKPELSANILFSGMGTQETGINMSGLFNLKVMSTSEIDIDAIRANAARNCGFSEEMARNYNEYPDMDSMARELEKLNIGFNPEKKKAYNWNSLKKRNPQKLREDWLACRLTKNLGDIYGINDLPYADLWTVSFPCQDISTAGKQAGFEEGSMTRSSTVWEQKRLLEKAVRNGKAPLLIMFENVKAILSEKHKKDFDALLGMLKGLGYNPYYDVQNAKDFGVPQNRERVFVICIRNDIDNGTYTFPEPTGNTPPLSSILDHGACAKPGTDTCRKKGHVPSARP